MTLITHFIIDSNISNEYVTFINKEFDSSEHNFITLNNHELNYLAPQDNLVKISSKAEYIKLIFLLHESTKILIHGLFDKKVIMLLSIMPWLLKKCSWVIWGGDLYGDVHLPYSKRSWKSKIFFKIKKFVCANFNEYITYIDGDYLLARQVYGGSALFRECIMYPSNISSTPIENIVKIKELDKTVNILVGNSAAITNHHIEAFHKIKLEHSSNYIIWCPLSYGDKKYASQVIEVGCKLFGDRFKPMTEMMALDKYQKFLSGIDIAIFNHNRQQGMGNIINLLGAGKVVYIRDDITTWSFFQRVGIRVYNSAAGTLNINQTLSNHNTNNIKIIKNYFSIDNLIKQSSLIFKGQ